MAARSLTEQVKVGLAAGAILAVMAGFVLARLRARAKENEAARKYMERTPIVSFGRVSLNASRCFMVALAIFAFIGTVNYNRYNTKLLMEGWDEYDLLHYYVNPKYFDELGYFRLLPAIILVDHDEGEYCPGKAPIYLAQDETDYYRRPIRHALARREEILSHFTPERWKEFSHDVKYLQRTTGRLPCNHWRQLLQDHGFNGTPVWVLVARPIVSMIPVEWIKLATGLDLVLIIAMLCAVAWAFGGQTFFFAWIFITVSYSFRWPTITWVMFRYDWLATMVIGICMIKKKKHIPAGAFFAYATCMRYFPVLWLFGIVTKGIHALFTRRDVPLSRLWLRIPIKYYKMALGFFIVVIVLVGISIARDGLDAHKQSLNNMFAHVEAHNLSSMRQGLVIALTYRGETDLKLISQEKKEMVEAMEPYVRGIGFPLLLILFVLFASRRKDWEVVGLGMIPYFVLTTSSYYYYSLRMTAIVIHAADLSKVRNIVGLFMLFGIELFCNASEHVMRGNRYFLICWMGILLTLYCITMFGILIVEWWRDLRSKSSDKPEGPPTEEPKSLDAKQ
ncbi:MAG: hypothetical protein GY854_24025 [Deltaproteobacteria bacterium]|nr:hypothetical protein [Deltaproteobacteria bacterium]